MGVDAYAVFEDWLKVCDSTKHDAMSLSLKKMGVPDRHVKWVEKLYRHFNAILNVGKEEISIECGCGERE